MNGVVLLNKNKGITSQEAVTKVKRLLRVKKAGHAGTLDPMATGLLIVCTNEATKITPFLMELEKEYVFKARFGVSTDTYDKEGKVVRIVEDFKLDRDELERVLEEFTGEIMQIPPMYSAVKIRGKPLHELARKGIEVERKPKKLVIHSIKIESFEPPFVTFQVVCSKGTYVRSLCHDIGEKLGIGAHVVELTRTRVGEFRVEEAVKLEELKSLSSSNLQSSALSLKPLKGIFSIDQALYFLPSITLQDPIVQRFLNGNSVKIPSGIVPAGWVKVKDKAEKIIGIGYGNGVIIKPERIIWEEG